MTEIIDGNAVAGDIRDEISDCVETLTEAGVTPGLATVLMSDDPASETYVSMKQQDCEEVGINGIHVEIDPDAPSDELFETIDRLNDDPEVHGILVQLPVPDHVDKIWALMLEVRGLGFLQLPFHSSLTAVMPVISQCKSICAFSVLSFMKRSHVQDQLQSGAP